jgi:hypothetical protein
MVAVTMQHDLCWATFTSTHLVCCQKTCIGCTEVRLKHHSVQLVSVFVLLLLLLTCTRSPYGAGPLLVAALVAEELREEQQQQQQQQLAELQAPSVKPKGRPRKVA